MGIGDFISGIFGSNNKQADQVNPYQTNSNAYQYGGAPGGAAAVAGGYRGYANNYNAGAANGFGTAYNSLNDANASRAEQNDALAMARARAQGQDLISQKITAQQQQQLAAQQASQAASARGPAALALSQQGAAANTAQGQSQLGAQGAIAGAQEQLANQQAYAQQAAGIRGLDLGAVGAGTNLGAAQGQLGLGYSGLENNVNQSQLTAQMNEQAQQSANYNAAHGIQAGAAGQNAATAQQNALGLVGVATGAAGGIGGLGGKAVGGAVHGSRPYLVGEQDPELVIPKHPGFVMNALQTAEVLGAPPTPQQLASLTPEQRHTLSVMRSPAPSNGQLRAREPAPMAREDGGPVYGMPTAAAPTWGTQTVPQAAEARGAEDGARWAQAQDAAKAQAIQDSLNYNYDVGGEQMAARRAVAAQTIANADRNRALGLYDNVEQDPEEAGAERQARYALGKDKQAAAAAKQSAPKQAPTETDKAYAEGRKLGARLSTVGSGLQSMAGQVDTGYHAPGAVAGPTLLALPTYQAREMGGPLVPSMTPPGEFDAGNGEILKDSGGMDPGASYRAMSDISTQYMRHGGSNPMGPASFAREEGGPVASKLDPRVSAAGHSALATFLNVLQPAQVSGAVQIGRNLANEAVQAANGLVAPPPALATRQPRAAVVLAPTSAIAVGTGHRTPEGVEIVPQDQRATLIHAGPVEVPEKVVSGARAYGGPISPAAKRKPAPKKRGKKK